ncbi:FtsK/SpoIIIE family DNA translocase [Curtanaerobium respiraculi]|uniref:FtsK/SpoIIIE family DNA translocase n=1 Tax=Curtanaerobium respiraculi TaxID=2949669 RepID=UPI0024B3486E|nr:DNA translocase FtsK [Curtanaerobium respiraculi]
MARANSSNAQNRKSKAPSPAQKAAARRAQVQQQPPGLLDEKSRRDIGGVCCAVLAIALFIMASMPQDGIVTGVLSTGLHLGLGLGCYILPFILILIAASLFYRKEGASISGRVAVGLLLLFVCIIVLLGLATPLVGQNSLQFLFVQDNLVHQGGYVGAGISWALLTLFGQPVSTVIVAGLIVVSFIIIGFSISAVVEKVRSKRREMKDQARAQEEALSVMPAPAFKPVSAGRGSIPRKRFGGKRDGTLRPVRTAVLPRMPGDPSEAGTEEFSAEAAGNRAQQARGAAKSSDSGQLTRKLGRKGKADAAQGKAKRQPAAQAPSPRPSEDFVLPPMELLTQATKESASAESQETLRDTAMLLQETLADFGVEATVVDWAAGPTVTLFKVSLPSGVRVSKVSNLTDDIALAMASQGVRIFSPIPGTNYVGIEVPNVKRRSVLLSDVLPAAGKGPLQVAIGEDVEGNPIVSDLAKMPHLLIGGTTGSGKSVSINGMIMSILMRATPAEVRFIMVDPKRVEFTPYNGIPHLYVPVVTECKEAASALSWAVAEMERRLKVFAKVGARNIGQYNAKAQAGMRIGDDEAEELPYIVIIIDELADLMMNVGKEVEFSISRLAQLARAAGIHMIVATQRPSTNVVTGLIKANITNRIAFNVASGIDSRVILDTPGAENLIGWGDMLLSKPEYPKPQRLQGCLVTEDEINAVVAHLKEQGEPDYHQEILQTNVMSVGDTAPDGSGGSSTADDPLIWEAAEIVVSSGLGSTSNIQRRLKVGYSRAGRIMDMLEDKGVVGPPNGSKPREVLVDTMELETLKAFEANDSGKE